MCPGRHPEVVSGSPVMRAFPGSCQVHSVPGNYWEGTPHGRRDAPERPAEAEKNYRVVALHSLRSSWTRRLAED